MGWWANCRPSPNEAAPRTDQLLPIGKVRWGRQTGNWKVGQSEGGMQECCQIYTLLLCCECNLKRGALTCLGVLVDTKSESLSHEGEDSVQRSRSRLFGLV